MWSDRVKQQLRELLNKPKMIDHDVNELLDMADGDLNRAVNMHFALAEHNSKAQSTHSTILPGVVQAPSTRRSSVAAVNVPPPPPPQDHRPVFFI